MLNCCCQSFGIGSVICLRFFSVSTYSVAVSAGRYRSVASGSAGALGSSSSSFFSFSARVWRAARVAL